MILSLDGSNAVKAGEMADTEGLHLIDGIIYSYVNEYALLLIGDKNFAGKPYVKLIRSNT